MSEDLAKFEITADVCGHGKVTINGEDVSRLVRAVSFQSQVGGVPVVTLVTLSADAAIAGEGIVRLQAPDAEEANSAEIVETFLNTVDPKLLEKEVLSRVEWGTGSTMAVALDVLRELARASA